MRTIECDVCGEPISAADDEELLTRLRTHLADEHDSTPDDDEIQQAIDREAYDATDSLGRRRQPAARRPLAELGADGHGARAA